MDKRRLLSRLLPQCNGLFSVPLLACLLAAGIFRAPQQVEVGSLTELRSQIAAQRGASHLPRTGGTYLEALEHQLAPRAFPDERVDWNALHNAAVHRDAMATFNPLILSLWEYVGPKNLTPPFQTGFGTGQISGRINDVAIDPNSPSTLYAAAPAGGIWKSTDAGTTWTALTDYWLSTATSSITIDPNNSNVLYVGTGDFDGATGAGLGIMRSTNGGTTWKAWGPSGLASYAIRRILVDPEDSTIVTVITGRGASGAGGVWRTDDGGDTWTEVITANAIWSDLVASNKDLNGNRVYYACAGGTNAQVWKSVDRGANWTKLTVPMRTGVSSLDMCDLATSPVDAGNVYLMGTGDKKVWKSIDAGANWTNLTSGALSSADWSAGYYDCALTCSRNTTGDVLYVGLVDLLQSWDGGTSWQTLMHANTGSDLAHVNQHAITVDPTNRNHVLATNDGGVYDIAIASNGSGTFTSLNATLGVTQLYNFDLHPTDTTRILAGSLSSGTVAALGDLANWSCLFGGVGGPPLINQSTPLMQYATFNYLGATATGGTIGFNRTANGWTSSAAVTTNAGTDRIAWEPPALMTPNAGGSLYYATNYLYRWTEIGAAWTSRLGSQQLSSNSTVTSLGVSPADYNTLYAGSGDAQLWVTRNGGTNWSQINTGIVSLPTRSYTALKVQPGNANDVLVGLSGTGVDHLWRCLDTSANSRTWVDVSGTGSTGLPDAPINSIEMDPANPTTVWFVGTDLGVFRTTDSGATWMNITWPYGLPNVQVTKLLVKNGYLYASTFGRGMWRLSTSATLNVAVMTLTVAPHEVSGTTSATGTVTINGAAPTGGVDVALASSDITAATVPASVHIDAGETSATFTVTTLAVTTTKTATISGTLGGNTASDDITVDPNGLVRVTVNPTTVLGGASATGTVLLGAASGSTATTVTLTSSDPLAVSVPSSVDVQPGQRSATFTVDTFPVSADTVVTISASAGGTTVTTTITVTAARLKTLTLNSGSVLGGLPSGGTVTLTGGAPAAGAVISLASSDTSAATVPATVTVPSGSTSATFVITTVVVNIDKPVTITATYLTTTKSASFTVTTQKVATLVLTPNPVIGGNNVTGTLTLLGPAANAITITLSASNPSLVTVPASVTIPAGSSSKTITITTKVVNVDTVVNILATAGGSSQSVPLTLQPMRLLGFTLSTHTAYAGQPVTGTITLNGPALSGGATIALTNTNPGVATVPSTVSVPQGATTKTFTITTNAAATGGSTTITASRGGISVQQVLTVVPIALQSLDLATYSVPGGTSVSGVVRIAVPAASGGYKVTLSSSNTTVGTLPATVTIGSGASSASFTVATKPVGFTTYITITAQHGNSIVSKQLQVLPPEVKTFTISPSTIKGGLKANGVVTLTSKAPAGGMTITISASPSLAGPTSSVKVAAGATSVSFKIATSAVSSTTQVSLSASAGSTTKFATLTLTK